MNDEPSIPQEGVSRRPATAGRGVKPVSDVAATAGGAFADALSAVAAPASTALPEAVEKVVTSLWPSDLVLVCPSGRRYRWPKAGARQNVAADDVEFLMSKNRSKGRACCGGSGTRTLFTLE